MLYDLYKHSAFDYYLYPFQAKSLTMYPQSRFNCNVNDRHSKVTVNYSRPSVKGREV
jgi:hypothetical protein